ncbi:hypothetical protein O6H91_01G018400 [Diphasiastrum complanatum]|uniref:Uncharacterized protein n=14 Tax=Diphasiastrum complanatum TaxID=34168 RepID=A0ACC2ENU4_DIPCM|nr:hypothetical protein O6H91_01G018400 [Diphasiastrum complanatum]KAJ7568088.1 hypothetical protein O6H91_01G018400 [Diphasiastrum complanatum]KAJ7568089.1 hypothetical protein O6H91_01G018400 [Diphasiastrum complanatum]KAJ7568090.1 hypothetical protein O6H91_01G018400 [Diphasiastrum complanatum]KAJ7568091.1 hypothetical protein O6H91_01G018400 [Diphasiastrum complanatum]
MFVATPYSSGALTGGQQEESTPKRVYQVWKGSNRFFLCGRLIFGPDVRSLVVTLFLITIPAVCFCVFVARNLMHKFSHHTGVAILVVAAVYTSFILVLLLLTSARDPGIVPRNLYPPEPEDELDVSHSPAEWGGQTPRFRLPRTRDIIVNGVAVKIKFCDTCMLYRPPRCSHCSICNNCVERFDHHCPWVGQCIGQRNYRFFFMFVCSTTLLCIYVFAMSALYIKILMDDTPCTVWRAMGKSPASVILMAYTFIAVWFVGGLTVFHLYLISTNQTTYENFRYRYDDKVNPYNVGVFNNFLEIFCSKITPSKNEFRAMVQQQGSGGIAASSQATCNARDIISPDARKKGVDVELGKLPWPIGGDHMLGDEALKDVHSRISNGGDIGVEMKDGFEDTFAHALTRVSHETGNMRGAPHPRRSSWGRKSGSWEITPDILAMASGVTAEDSQVNAASTPSGNR